MNQFFTPTGNAVRRETRLSLSVRMSCVKRSLQIVVLIQRRLALARPDANPAKGNQCN